MKNKNLITPLPKVAVCFRWVEGVFVLLATVWASLRRGVKNG